jgi:hypothetical protein
VVVENIKALVLLVVEELSEALQAKLALVVDILAYLKVQYHKEMPLLLPAAAAAEKVITHLAV